jgi:cell division protein FtsB
MKLTHCTLTFLFAFILIFNVLAQSKNDAKREKEERKKWKEKKSKVEPLQYRDMLKEMDELKAENEALKRQNASMQSGFEEKEALKASLQKQIVDLKSGGGSGAAVKTESNEVDASYKVKGIIFRVQVGAYRKIDLSKFKDNNRNFAISQDGDMLKYELGSFSNPREAYSFKKYMMKIGVPSPWVVAYKDGQKMTEDIRTILKSVGVTDADLETDLFKE